MHLLILVLPSAPRNVAIAFVNQSTVEIRWVPPAISGDQTHVHYDVECLKSCDSNKKCVLEYCEKDVNYIPFKEGLNVAKVIVTDLSPFGKYTFKIYAKNRVSDVAKRKHGKDGDFTAITVRTNGSSKLWSSCNIFYKVFPNSTKQPKEMILQRNVLEYECSFNFVFSFITWNFSHFSGSSKLVS